MRYREITKSDITDMAGLFVKAFNAPPWNDEWTEEVAYKRLRQMLDCDGAYGIIGMEEDRVCGFILGCREHYYDAPHFQIKELCVLPDVQGGGAGTALMRELESRLRARGVRELYLLTARVKELVGFYGKNGFAEPGDMVMLSKSISN